MVSPPILKALSESIAAKILKPSDDQEASHLVLMRSGSFYYDPLCEVNREKLSEMIHGVLVEWLGREDYAVTEKGGGKKW